MENGENDFQDFYVDWAFPEHIDSLMLTEDKCFAEGIREERSVFLERLETSFFCNTVLKYQPFTGSESGCSPDDMASEIYGYFCSEIRGCMPGLTKNDFALGHSAKEAHDPEGHILYISSFAVRPDAPRKNKKGLGRFFFRRSLDMILKKNQKIGRIVLIVNEDWAPARRIYETEGFITTGEIPGFFETADGRRKAYVMEKILKKG
ncbi:MAG: hypothetical protein II940_03320 [Methanosarcinaceae archaeon]|nr:hypothetical protein [Methanosarcinaceae archaeon]